MKADRAHDQIEAHNETVEAWRSKRPRDLWRLQDATEYDILRAGRRPPTEYDTDLEEEFFEEIADRFEDKPDW